MSRMGFYPSFKLKVKMANSEYGKNLFKLQYFSVTVQTVSHVNGQTVIKMPHYYNNARVERR